MDMENIKSLTLEDETFEEPRQNFNRVLQRLFKSMIESGSTEGSITMKMDVTLEQEYIPNYDPNVEGESRKISKPSFKHKVSSTVTVKDEMGGNKDPQMELVWDEDKQMYILAYISNTDQRSIFDADQPWNQNRADAGSMPEDQTALEDRGAPQIEGPVADEHALPGDVVDGDFREVEEDDGDGYEYDDPDDPDNDE